MKRLGVGADRSRWCGAGCEGPLERAVVKSIIARRSGELKTIDEGDEAPGVPGDESERVRSRKVGGRRGVW